MHPCSVHPCSTPEGAGGWLGAASISLLLLLAEAGRAALGTVPEEWSCMDGGVWAGGQVL